MNKPSIAHQTLFLLVSGVIFSLAYAIHSDMSGSISKPESLATFHAHWPYRPRFLTAWIAYHIFGGPALNTVLFRAALAFVCWVPSVLLLGRFADRLRIASPERSFLVAAFLLIMLAHYCLPNVAAPYYIYDMPAILFYLIVFLLLTSTRFVNIILGGVCTLIFTMNREPIAVAAFHALAWWMLRGYSADAPDSDRSNLITQSLRNLTGLLRNRERMFAVIAIVLTLFGTVVMRQILVLLLEGNAQASFYVMLHEDDQIRVVANLRRVATEWGNFQQFVATGFGAVIYLPFVYKHQNIQTRALLAISIIPLAPLVLVGNFFTELRIYGEYIPLLSCLLCTVIAWGGPNASTTEFSA